MCRGERDTLVCPGPKPQSPATVVVMKCHHRMMRVLQDPTDTDTDTDTDKGKGTDTDTDNGKGKGTSKGTDKGLEMGPWRTSPDLKPTLSRGRQGEAEGRFSSTPGSAVQCSPVRPTDRQTDRLTDRMNERRSHD